VHRRSIPVQPVESLEHLVRDNRRQVCEGLPYLRGSTAQISQAMNHFQRHAQIRLQEFALAFLGVYKPLADPVDAVRECDLGGEFPDGPESMQRTDGDGPLREIREDLVELFLRDFRFACLALFLRKRGD